MASLSNVLWVSSVLTSLVAFTSAFPTIKERDSTCFPPENSVASEITWIPCPPEVQAPEGLECGTYSVPINWDEPYGDKFDLGLVRLPAMASNLTTKIGSLFINPGGPGGRASELVRQLALGALPSEILLGSFDIIGLDPRGVGLSHQVECDPSIYAERVSLFPRTKEELDKLVDKNKRFGQSCREKTGPLFEHLDTISAAKDHEAVRIALGNEPINFVGLSYGSQLGAQYAALFPDNIRTLVLDGILQHSQSEAQNILIETSSYNLGLTHFFEWATKDNSSALQGQDVSALWTSLIANASDTPIPASICDGSNCQPAVSGEDILFNAQKFLTIANAESSTSWGTLAAALHNASQGDASALSTPLNDPVAISYLGIGCLDWTHSTSLSLPPILAKQTMATQRAPLTQAASQMWQAQLACVGWPVPVKNPPAKLDVDTEATVLLVQSTADPSTGLPWALGMLEEVRNKVLVLREGDGHTSLGLGGETAEVIVEYLVSGEAPGEGLVLSS